MHPNLIFSYFLTRLLATQRALVNLLLMSFAAATLIASHASAQNLLQDRIATARLIADIHSRDAQGNFWAGVNFTLPSGWHIYWQNPGDSGLPPSIEWHLPAGITPGEIHWPVPHRFVTEGLVNYGYSDNVTLPISMLSKQATQGILKANLRWLVCRDVCIPESAALSIDLAKAATKPDKIALENAIQSVPQIHRGDAYFVTNQMQTTIAIQIPENVTLGTNNFALFPISEGIIRTQTPPQFEIRNNWLLIHAQSSTSAQSSAAFKAVLRANSTDATPIMFEFNAKKTATLPPSVPAESEKKNLTLLPALLLALLGGLILNAMPCVLPVLSLKALSLSKIAEKSRRASLYEGLAYTLGILVSFAVIGIGLLILKSGGQAVGWGFQLQSPAFVLMLAIITTLVALNLMGLFELPVLLGTNTLSNQGYWGSFFTGVLAVALATPCTAPFMAPALGYALTQPPAVAIAVLLSVGFGLALPYLLISFSPALRHLLPKPGAWMLRFKQFLAFPMIATTGWLLWVLMQQTGSIGIIAGFCTVFFVALSAWGIATSTARLSKWFWWGVMSMTIGVSLLMPPRTLQLMPEIMSDTSMEFRTENFSLANIAALNAEGKNVFVDVTAAWCLTCKINERLVLHTQATHELFQKHHVTVMVADWTQRDDAITEFLASYDRSGVPFYVYYPAQGTPVVLPSLLTYSIVKDAVTAR